MVIVMAIEDSGLLGAGFQVGCVTSHWGYREVPKMLDGPRPRRKAARTSRIRPPESQTRISVLLRRGDLALWAI